MISRQDVAGREPAAAGLDDRPAGWLGRLTRRHRELASSLRQRPRLVVALKILGFALSVALVAYVAVGAFNGFSFDGDDLVLLAASLIPALVSWVALARAWAALSGAPSTAMAVGSWARTQALRYIPGSVWAPAARATSVEGAPITKTSAVLVEAGLTIAVGAGIGGLGLAASGHWAWAFLLLIPAASGIVFAAVLPRAGIPQQRLKAAIAWYTFSWVTYAVSVVMTQAALGTLQRPLYVMAAGCLSRVAGNAALFSPGGIGVREVVYVALASSVVSHGAADAGAIATRLVLTVAELLVLVALGVPRGWLRTTARGPGADGAGHTTAKHASRRPAGAQVVSPAPGAPCGRGVTGD